MSKTVIPPSIGPQGRSDEPTKRDLLPTPESYELPTHSALGGHSNGLVDALRAAADPDHKLHAVKHRLAKVAASLGSAEGVAQAGGAFTAFEPPKKPQ